MRIIICFIFIPFLLFNKGTAYSQDSTNLESQINDLNKKTIELWLNYPDSSMRFARKALKLSEKLNEPKFISKSLRLIGGVYNYLGNYDSVIHYSILSYKIAFQIQDSILMNNALNNNGLANFNLGRYQTALELLLRSLKLKKSLGEIYGLATTLNNIGLVYDKLKDFDRSREYFKEALEIAKQNDDKNQILYSQNNIGLTYIRENNLDEAEKYFQLSLEVQVDNKNWKSVTYTGMGQIFQKRGEFKSSRNYFNKAKKLREEIGDRKGISEILYLFSQESNVNGNYDSALYYLNQSQVLAEQIGANDRVFENLELYVSIYSNLEQYKSSYEYQTKLLRLRDTLFNENMARDLSGIQLKIQEEDNLMNLAKKEQQINENKRFTNFLILTIFFFLLIVMFAVYQVYNNKKKNEILRLRNNEIYLQKEEIETQKESLVDKNTLLESAQALIKSQNRQLEEYNKTLRTKVVEKSDELKERNDQLLLANLELDNFIYKSSHDIKGPLATLLGMCNVALLDIKDEKSRDYFLMLNETALGLNAILARLKTISDISSIDIKLKEVDLVTIIEKCVDQNRKIEGDEKIYVNYNFKNDYKFISDPVLLDLIFFNLIQSIIKMRDRKKAKKSIELIITKTENEMVIDIVDNGLSKRKEDLGDVFELFAKTALHHRTLGLGLYIVKQSVLKFNGKIVLLDDNSRTHFKIEMPIFN